MVEWRNSYAWLTRKVAEVRAMGWNKNTLTAAGIALGLTTFGVGFITAKATDGGSRPGQGVAVSEVIGSFWGKPRDARAAGVG